MIIPEKTAMSALGANAQPSAKPSVHRAHYRRAVRTAFSPASVVGWVVALVAASSIAQPSSDRDARVLRNPSVLGASGKAAQAIRASAGGHDIRPNDGVANVGCRRPVLDKVAAERKQEAQNQEPSIRLAQMGL